MAQPAQNVLLYQVQQQAGRKTTVARRQLLAVWPVLQLLTA
jgi:hypothetical protein